MKKVFRKRIFTVRTFFRSLKELYDHFGEVKKTFRNKRVSKAFAERIMLSVTNVNGCRYCSYAHTRVAMAAGISKSEIDNLMNSEYQNVPGSELKALLFAQHFAETEGKYDQALWKEIIALYGDEVASDILVYIRMIMLGNLSGNTFDAFILRFKGYKTPGSNAAKELLILASLAVWAPLVILAGSIFKR